MPTKLLVADDDPAVRSAVADVVADDFDVVLEANNGLEALDVVRQEQPDVVLLDLEMPGLNGIDTCRQLRSLPQVRNTPILMLTVHNAAGKVRAAFDAGASDYIFKPFQIGQLRARLRTWALRGDVIAEVRHPAERARGRPRPRRAPASAARQDEDERGQRSVGVGPSLT